LDKPLYLTWLWKRGVRPSEFCLQHGLDGYLPLDSANRIKGKLAAVVGANAEDRSIFLYALQQAESAANQRVTVFNALAAYHRALFMLTAIAVGISVALVCGWGPQSWSKETRWGMLICFLLLFLLFWHRTKQRAFYYVREVLLTAERVIDQKPAAAA